MTANLKEIEYIIKYMSEEILTVLKVDLTADTFEIIKALDDNLKEKDYSSDKYSELLKNSLAEGRIHPLDLDNFSLKADLSYLRSFFQAGNKKLAISYRRIMNNNYKWVSMRLIPAYNYSSENQVILLFVQLDDSAESLDLIQTARQQFAIMKSIAGTFVTMHAINFADDSVYDLSSSIEKDIKFFRQENATELMHKIMKMRISDEYLERALEFSELSTLQDRMTGKKYITMDLLGKIVGWVRAQFITIQSDENGRPLNVLFTTSAINEEKRREEKMMQLSTELNLATAIQTGCLPCTFPAFPNRKEFDLYASMDPAKEVGGDFYDFFDLGSDKIAFVIADVSGKGIPAALFMMICKVLIENQARDTVSPAEILAKVNHQLCSNNPAEMFVTVWLGILDLKTGIITAANAGHEYPAIRRRDGKFDLLKDRHGFVLGGMDGARFKEYDIQLEKGDTLFVYTDGVPEANRSDGSFFGTERMLEALNRAPDASCKELIENMKKAIADFIEEAPQFDDTTMMTLKFFG